MAQCTSILAVAALLGALAAGALVSRPEIIAHRGASFDAPENTVAAFKLAWQQNADGIEGDFRLTSDGKIICSHDATTKRVGDKDLEVAKSTFDELRQVDVGAKKGAAWKGERMPSIDEALAVVQPGKKIYIEIYNPQSVPILRQSIERSSLRPEQTVVISFDRKTVAAAKEGLPKLKAYWLVDLKKDKAAGLPNRGAEEIVSVLKEIRADGVDCSDNGAIDAALVSRIHSAGFEFHVWTIDDAAKAGQLKACGVDSITTNRPQWIRDRL